jgi:hypothetical protein
MLQMMVGFLSPSLEPEVQSGLRHDQSTTKARIRTFGWR